ncbi:DUF4190 domain-containing protein [Streptomyces ziwulingensis]
MTDATQPGGDANGAHDPWAPPGSRPSLDKGHDAASPARPAGAVPPWQPPPSAPPPSVHDQATIASMPSPVFGAAENAVPPPPVAPGGPGAPGGYGYPGYPQGYGWPGVPAAPQNGMGTAAMVLGILACCLFCLYGVVSLVLGVLAVVFGIKGRRRAEEGLASNHGQAQAGFVMGIVGIVLGIAVIVLLAVGIVAAINSDSDYEDPYYGISRPVPVSVPAQS